LILVLKKESDEFPFFIVQGITTVSVYILKPLTRIKKHLARNTKPSTRIMDAYLKITTPSARIIKPSIKTIKPFYKTTKPSIRNIKTSESFELYSRGLKKC
jgi:hypothetical protein